MCRRLGFLFKQLEMEVHKRNQNLGQGLCVLNAVNGPT